METSSGHLPDPAPWLSEDDYVAPLPTDVADTSASSTSDTASKDTSPVVAPPYWYAQHGRTVSNVSYQSIGNQRPIPILLEDHSAESNVFTQSCWAKSATIDEYVLVSGPTGIGAYVVWHCTVETLKGGDMTIRKRYSEFDQLRENLVRAFPHAEAMIPELPRKSVVSRFRPRFLEARKAGLSHFLNCILLNPEFAASPILKDFIFS